MQLCLADACKEGSPPMYEDAAGRTSEVAEDEIQDMHGSLETLANLLEVDSKLLPAWEHS